jgi:hypothetical protein
MHTNGNEEKGKEGRQEKEVVPFEASSREPSVPKVFATAKTFSFFGRFAGGGVVGVLLRLPIPDFKSRYSTVSTTT